MAACGLLSRQLIHIQYEVKTYHIHCYYYDYY